MIIYLIILIILMWAWIRIYSLPRYLYKVVKVEPSGVQHSCMVDGYARVDYTLNKKSRAPKNYAKGGYHILAFNSLTHAYIFAGHRSSYRILKCSYNFWDIRKLPKKRELEYVGEYANILTAPITETFWPDGTICVKALTPRSVEYDWI